MFTKNDEKTIENVMRTVVNEVVSDVVDDKLKPLNDFRKEATRILDAILEDLQGKHEFEREVDKRVLKLERIHPDNSHASIL